MVSPKEPRLPRALLSNLHRAYARGSIPQTKLTPSVFGGGSAPDDGKTRFPRIQSICHLRTFGNSREVLVAGNVVLPNLIKQSPVANAQQFGGTLAIPAGLLQ